MAVDFDELFRLVGDLHKLAGRQLLLNAEDNSLVSFDTDSSGTELMICVNQISQLTLIALIAYSIW